MEAWGQRLPSLDLLPLVFLERSRVSFFVSTVAFSPNAPLSVRGGEGGAVNMMIPRPRGPVAFPQLGNLPMAFAEAKPRILPFEEYAEFLADLETDCVTWAELGPSFRISQFVGPKASNVPMECVQDLLRNGLTKLVFDEEGGNR